MPEEGRWAGRNRAASDRRRLGRGRDDQLETIPYLARLRDLMVERKSG